MSQGAAPLFPVISGDDWRRSILAGRARTNEARAQIALAVTRWRLLRALRKRAAIGA